MYCTVVFCVDSYNVTVMSVHGLCNYKKNLLSLSAVSHLMFLHMQTYIFYTKLLHIFDGISMYTYHNIEFSVLDECSGNDKVPKSTPLHHIIEFGKRSKVEGKGCKNSSNSKSSGSILGLHNLLHARSQQKNKHNAFEGKNKVSSSKNNTFQKSKNEVGSKRTNAAELHKLQLKTETISMLHKIVEKYFPGGHLTVDQKIKALKILGKLIKLKKEGKNSDIKKLLGALSTHKQSDGSSSTSDISKVKTKSAKNEESGKKDNTNESGGSDIYANIASGPDVPKLPPSVSEKDPEHVHSNIMPVGLQPLGRGGAGESFSRSFRRSLIPSLIGWKLLICGVQCAYNKRRFLVYQLQKCLHSHTSKRRKKHARADI